MSPAPEGINGHAAVLESDALTLTECAARLREIWMRLEADQAAPQWLRESVDAHLAACAVAAADLTGAAARLRRYAERARS